MNPQWQLCTACRNLRRNVSAQQPFICQDCQRAQSTMRYRLRQAWYQYPRLWIACAFVVLYGSSIAFGLIAAVMVMEAR